MPLFLCHGEPILIIISCPGKCHLDYYGDHGPGLDGRGARLDDRDDDLDLGVDDHDDHHCIIGVDDSDDDPDSGVDDSDDHCIIGLDDHNYRDDLRDPGHCDGPHIHCCRGEITY